MQNISNVVKAQVLNDALPYIQKYHDKIVVIKYGGNAMTSEELKNAVMSDIVLLSLVGIKAVLVHGGQVPVDAFALHRDPRLGQALDDLLGGKGMVLVALLIEQADQGQGAVSLIGMGFPHGSSLLWVSGSIIEQMF